MLLLSTQPTQEIDIIVYIAWHTLNGTLEGLQSLSTTLFAWFYFSRTLLGNVWESSSLVMCFKITPKKKNKRKRALESTPPNKAGKKLKDKAECTVYITCHICEDPIY